MVGKLVSVPYNEQMEGEAFHRGLAVRATSPGMNSFPSGKEPSESV